MGKLSVKQFFTQNKKYFITGLLLIIAGLFIYSVIVYVRHLQEPVVPAIQAIPPEVAWFGEFKNATTVWEKVSSGNDIATESLNFPWFNTLFARIAYLDSLVYSSGDAVSLCKDQSVYVCCRYNERGEAEYLFMMNMPDAHQEQTVCDFIQDGLGTTLQISETTEGNHLYFTGSTSQGEAFSFTVPSGIFMFSTSDAFVRSALRHLNAKTGLVNDKKFAQIMATTGKKVDANIYFNLDYLNAVYGSYLGDPPGEFSLFLDALGYWAGMDLIIRKDELLLSGYLNAEKGDYLDLFSDNIPQKITLTRQVPFNTAVMLFFGAEDLNLLSEKQALYHQTLLNANENPREALEEKYHLSLENDIFSWMGKEAALIITESPSGAFRDNSYGVFSVRNAPKATEMLAKLSVETEEISPDPESGKALFIRKMNIPELFPALFGSSFSYVTGNYFVILNDLVVFGNSPQALKTYISSIFSGKTLSTNENYISFADNVSGKASVCLYINIRKSAELLKSMLNPEMRELLDPLTPHIKNFQAFAIQITPEQNLLYTNLYLKFNPSYKDENPAVWEAKLDTTAACPPVIALSIADSSANIIIYDVLNQIYIIDAMGRVSKKIRITDPITGPLKIIENRVKRKSYILFNTTHQIYLIDLQGNPARGFPVTTKFPVTNTASAIDYNNRGDHRLLFACDDRKIYNYTLEGRPTVGWSIPQLSAEIHQPIEHIKLFAKDYLIVTDIDGTCHFYNKNGKEAFYPSATEFIASEFPSFFLYDDGKNSRIITTDHKGRIIRISADGDWESINLKEFPEAHSFLYDDFNGDEIKDYIYTDTNTVTVYNNSKKIIFELDMPAGIIPGIVRLTCSGDKPVFGVVSRSTDHIFLFSEQGWSSMNNVLSGSWPLCSAYLDKSGYCSLVTASNKTVYNYYLYDLTIIPF